MPSKAIPSKRKLTPIISPIIQALAKGQLSMTMTPSIKESIPLNKQNHRTDELSSNANIIELKPLIRKYIAINNPRTDKTMAGCNRIIKAKITKIIGLNHNDIFFFLLCQALYDRANDASKNIPPTKALKLKPIKLGTKIPNRPITTIKSPVFWAVLMKVKFNCCSSVSALLIFSILGVLSVVLM